MAFKFVDEAILQIKIANGYKHKSNLYSTQETYKHARILACPDPNRVSDFNYRSEFIPHHPPYSKSV